MIPTMTYIKLNPRKLVAARHNAGYSLRELARLLGGTPDHNRLWEYEHGRRSPQPRTIRHLAEVLGVEVRDLLQEKEEDS
jgi:transcriptional regulator with XRE-family HTH domain